MGWISRLDIRIKAPLGVAILVIVVGASISTAAYFMLRRELNDHAAGRLVTLKEQHVETYRASMANSRRRISEAANHPALVAFLHKRESTTEADALAAMTPPGPAPEWIVRVELRDNAGRILLIAPGHRAQANTQFTSFDEVDGLSLAGLASSNETRIGFGTLERDGENVRFPIIAAIAEPAAGYLVVWRRVATTWQAAQQVATVMGDEAAVYMVNADGSLWSQFGKPVASSPEPPDFDGVMVYDRAETGRVLSVSGPMENTPWAFVFEYPEETVQAPAQAFLRTLAWIGPVFILLGTLAAWHMSRRLTEPLHQLTKAADAIASGDLSYRAPVSREDELGRLSAAFNNMAAEVEESRIRLESLVEAERALRDRELLERVVRSQEAERYRIARDLHDHLGQQLTGIRLALADLHQCSDGSAAIREKVELAQEKALALDRDVSLLAIGLRGSSLKERGLAAELQNLVTEWSRNFQVSAQFQIVGARDDGRLPDEVEVHLYRIAQEALNNTFKHASAGNVSVVLNFSDRGVRLLIEDDGVGFDPSRAPDHSLNGHGMGLMGMRERADLIGADLEIDSKPGVGTSVFVTVRNAVRTPLDSPPEKLR